MRAAPMQWHLRSWQNAKQLQQPTYPDHQKLETILTRLAKLPPLVTPDEVNQLKRQIAEAAAGKRFLLQAGDCAESFANCSAPSISKQVRILQQMSLVLMSGFSKPITTIGRIAGQYAKPRTTLVETHGKLSLPSYRGDLINGQEFSAQARQADPERLIQGYGYSSMTLNYIRSFKQGTLAELSNPISWHEPLLDEESQQILVNLGQSLSLMDQLQSEAISTELYTSHESLLLHYEQALTRQYQDSWYNLSTHFPWIGMRTAQSNSGQVEYLRGIENPIAIKVGPDIKVSELLELIATLNPQQESGKITLITRFGADHIQRCLPELIKAIKKSKHPVLWCSDPMHGNSRMTGGRYKTRDISQIHKELCLAFDIHQQHQSIIGAVHLEVSGMDVTECCGGLGKISEDMLSDNYQSLLDPRLNRFQSLETALLMIKKFKQQTSKLHLINN
jgi:3-deoxy-7-phosphoheptulonate synthase